MNYNNLKRRILNSTGLDWSAQYIREVAEKMLKGEQFDPKDLKGKTEDAFRLIVQALEDDYAGVETSTDVIEVEPIPSEMRVAAKRGAEITQVAIESVATKLIEHFVIQDDHWVVDPENPPTVAQSYEVASEALGLNAAAQTIESASSWLTGNIVSELRQLHGEDFDISLICDQTGKSYNTMITSEVVFNAFKGRIVPGASFSLHKEAHYTKGMTDVEKTKAVIIAANNNLTVKKFAKVCRAVVAGKKHLLEHGHDMDVIAIAEGGVKVEPRQFILIKDNGKFSLRKGELTPTTIKAYHLILQIKPTYAIIKDSNNFFK